MTWKYKQLIILYFRCRLQKDSFVLQVFDHEEEKYKVLFYTIHVNYMYIVFETL